MTTARAQALFEVTQAYYDAALSERLVTIAEAIAVVDTAQKLNRVVTVGVQSMADPTWRAAHEYIAAGNIVSLDVEAARHGIGGTPGFLVNGRLLSGNMPLETFVEVVEEELQDAGSR